MASKRRLRRNSCTKKRAYSQGDADSQAEYYRKQGSDIYSYRCAFGSHYHIGHRPNKLIRAIDENDGLTSMASVGRFKRL